MHLIVHKIFLPCHCVFILQADFEAYLDGFSPNVQEILEKFKFRNQIATMIDADILGSVIEKFVSADINLSPNPIYKDEVAPLVPSSIASKRRITVMGRMTSRYLPRT